MGEERWTDGRVIGGKQIYSFQTKKLFGDVTVRKI